MPYITLSQVITATMLFLQFVADLSFVGTQKNEIVGAALELCQLKIEHFSPGILKFNTKHEDTPFTLNCSMVPCTFLFIFHASLCGLGSKNFRNSSYKKKWPVRLVFPDYLSVSYNYEQFDHLLIVKIFVFIHFHICHSTLWDKKKCKIWRSKNQ